MPTVDPHIYPNSAIQLFRDIPITNDYNHTLYFASANNRDNTFTNLVTQGLVFAQHSYQRVESNRIRLQSPIENVYNCNYLRFNNYNFVGRWFYAFINEVKYINNEVTEIEYEIDVITTWLWDATMEQCFVLREHSNTDILGENLEAEDVDVGEYVFNDYSTISNIHGSTCVILAVSDYQLITGHSQIYDGIYSGLAMFAFELTDYTGISNKIGEYLQSPDSIVSMYMCPRFLVNGDQAIQQGGMRIPANYRSAGYILQNVSGINTSAPNKTTLNGYTPRNNKLYTYPYNFYHVDNGCGETLALRYEFFETKQVCFIIHGSFTQPVTTVIYPSKYKGINGNDYEEYRPYLNECIEIKSFPLCSWNVDYYQAFLAQSAVPMGLNFVSSAVMAAAIPNAGVGAASLLGSVTGAISANYKASIHADIVKGNLSNSNLPFSMGTLNFHGGRCSISQQKARIIDTYFDMFGYATNKCKIPGIRNRLRWSYVKTAGMSVRGNLPAQAVKQISAIFDNGITFWVNMSEVGHYELDNPPIPPA